MRSELDALRAGLGAAAPERLQELDASERERLRALGYLRSEKPE
jgi:hypothetical protein